MKQKLTITVDAELLPLAKRYARSRGEAEWIASTGSPGPEIASPMGTKLSR